ncbi:hypothetical protein T11_3462 [Trichinella zimbabwensis]|uniref:Uncharacterized protein n=1 Tax=Trichinella zimbabwensis TaxID=268475 RepID=A0A0V1HWU9_9BILA|nr:hypothetical protein T11_3462 [Trichinella zimbabwensis]
MKYSSPNSYYRKVIFENITHVLKFVQQTLHNCTFFALETLLLCDLETHHEMILKNLLNQMLVGKIMITADEYDVNIIIKKYA